MSKSEDAEMTAYTSRGMTIYPPPQPVEQIIKDRLKNLLTWWKRQTGIDVFMEDLNFRFGWQVLRDPNSPDWLALEVIASACGPSNELMDLVGWKIAGRNQVNDRRNKHERLVKAAKAVLTRPGMSFEDSVKKISDDLARYDEMGPNYGGKTFRIPDARAPSPDIAFWDMLAGPEACKAALLLVNLPNPYPKNRKKGRGYYALIEPEIKRLFLSQLCLLKKSNGRPLTDKERALLALFLRPDYFDQFPDNAPETCPPSYLSGLSKNQDDSWRWGNQNTSSNAALFLQKSKGFKQLTNTLAKLLKDENSLHP